MDRQKLSEIILACKESSQEEGMSCYLPGELTKNMCLNILKKCAPSVDQKDVMAVFTAFVLTENALYGKDLDSPLPLDGSWKAVPIYKGDILNRVLIIFRDGTLCENFSLRHILPLLKRLSAAFGQEKESLQPKADCAKLHSLYGRQIRRQLEEAVNDSCGEWDRLYLRASFPDEKIEKAIQLCQADIQPSDVIAMEDANLLTARIVYLLTEYGLYAAYDKKPEPPVLFDGLREIIPGKNYVLYFLYEDGHGTETIPREAPAEKFLRRVLSIYDNIRELMVGGDHKPVLDFADGWNKFLSLRKNDLLENRKNSIFVSSTFRDMHFERDAIHELVLPALNEAGNQYGQSMSFCDLRWGVNTEDLDSEAGSKKVLTVCLDEIERCRPYMLVILGERYGWVPDPDLIQSAAAGRLDCLEDLEKSVTALEIEFGALSHTDQLERTRFYFRTIEGAPPDIYESEDQWHAQKLERLKQRIQKLAGNCVKTYTLQWDHKEQRLLGLEEFSRTVTQDILQLMETEWAKAGQLPPLEKELSSHWALAKQKAMQCGARDRQLKELFHMLKDGEGLVAVQGVSGSGKTTLMSCLATVLSLSGADVLPLFCGHTVKSSTAVQLMQIITDFLGQRLKDSGYSGEIPDSRLIRSYGADRLRAELNRLAAEYMKSGEKTMVILIDGVDQLPPDRLRDSFKFLPSGTDGRVRSIISCTEDFPTAPVHHVFSLPLLQETERPVVIQGILNSMHRELADSVVKAMAEKTPSASPLYISFLLQRLLMMNKADFDDIAKQGDGIDAITARQLALVREAPDTLPGICAWLLSSAADRVGQSLSQEIMEYLAVSRYGLRETDLEKLLQEKGIPWNALDFSLFINYINGMFLRREDGRYDFTHKSIRAGLLERSSETKERHRQICRLLETLPRWDQVRVQEWGYHCCQAEDGKRFTDYLAANRQDEDALRHMAAEAARSLSQDKGAFLRGLFSEQLEESSLSSLIYFLVRPLFSSRELSRENLILLGENVLPAGIPLAEKLVEKTPSPENLHLLSLLYFQTGEAKWENGEQEKTGLADWYERSLSLARKRRELSDSRECRRDLAEILTNLGQVHAVLKNTQKAGECYSESLKLLEEGAAAGDKKSREQTADLYLRMGSLCRGEGGSGQLDMAEKYYLKAVSAREELWEETGGETARNALALSYKRLAGLYLMWKCPGHGQKALDYYLKELPLREQSLQENPCADTQEGIALACQGAGSCLEIIQSAGYQDQALAYYEQSIACWEVIVREAGEDSLIDDYINGRDDAISHYIDACLGAAGILNEIDGASRCVRAAQLYQRALDFAERIVQKKESEHTYLRLMISLQKAMGASPRVYKAFQTDVSSRIVETARILYKLTGNSDYKDYGKSLKKWRLVKKVGMKFMDFTGL